jgi:hypothetical protein
MEENKMRNAKNGTCIDCGETIKEGVMLNGQLWKIIDGENKGGLLGKDYPGTTWLQHTDNYLFCNKCFMKIFNA